jgi:alanine-glyoxylate transaminase/serine-glyoxylate transaminase/serine-pyruvate transaminase
LDPEFLTALDEIVAMLRQVYGLQSGLTLPLSGTGGSGMEAGLANLLEPGDRAVIGVNGFFGERLAEIARRQGADVARLRLCGAELSTSSPSAGNWIVTPK